MTEERKLRILKEFRCDECDTIVCPENGDDDLAHCSECKDGTEFHEYISQEEKEKKTLLCPRCKTKVSYDPKHISGGYYAACLKCDEDFYSIELVEEE